MKISLTTISFCLLALSTCFVNAQESNYEPKIAEASNDAEQAIPGFKVPEGAKVSLVAAEPSLANPVAFTFDEQGRLIVCETFRQSNGVEDNRGHMNWLIDDLKAQSVQDRIDYIKRFEKNNLQKYTRDHDRLRLLTDKDGNGVYEYSQVFADGFNAIEEGTGAGVLSYNGTVYYTCIPKLWGLKDTNNDGVADEKNVLQDGFGVRFAFRGHDMHGLVLGPDGRLYFSIGDRGYNLTTKEGKTFKRPDTGAVFRCELDGSDLEVYAYGLRNPQELVFDKYGNLFTGDNNSDSGDQARWVYIAQGSDTGWRMYYQYLNDRGPWNRERMWYPYKESEQTTEVQPAYILPPILNISDGPSGLTYDPGFGLPENLKDHFFLVDFRGQASNSGIRTFAVEPEGATFKLVDSEKPIWNMLATDAEFGYDGALYFSDWINGWNGEGKGRVYKVDLRSEEEQKLGEQVAQMFREGFDHRSTKELAELLEHTDRRVRQRAQFQLADRNAVDEMLAVLANSKNQLARIHAIWGIGQVGRRQCSAYCKLADQWEDQDPEIVTQITKVLSESEEGLCKDRFLELLSSENPRWQYFAAMGLGRLGQPESIEPLLSMIAANADTDPALRHAGSYALSLIGKPKALLEATQNHPSKSVRLAAVVALRRHASPLLAQFLNDKELDVVTEAARAINDEHIAKAMPKLAKLAETKPTFDPLVRRVMHANYRLGKKAHAAAVVAMAADTRLEEKTRIEALSQLQKWNKTEPLDRVTNMWRSWETERSSEFVADLLKPHLAGLLSDSEKIRKQTIDVTSAYQIADVVPRLMAIVSSPDEKTGSRVDALKAIGQIDKQQALKVTKELIQSDVTELRSAARALMAKVAPEEAIDLLVDSLDNGSLAEKQIAVTALSGLKLPAAKSALKSQLETLANGGEIHRGLILDLLEAVRKYDDREMNKIRRSYLETLKDLPLTKQFEMCAEGGNVQEGVKVFYGAAAASCRRCHVVNGQGGGVGPDLSEIGKEKTLEYLLESVVEPNAVIAKGFETVLLVTIDGKIETGIVKEENDETLLLLKANSEEVRFFQDDILERSKGQSGMPADLYKSLTKAQIRDVIAYLATLKKREDPESHGEGGE